MFGFWKDRSARKFARRINSVLATAARGVIEQLEGRVLLSAAPNTYLQALGTHTLTAAELQSHDLVAKQWQGREIYARKSEWILSLVAPKPILSSSGNLVDLNIDWAGPSVKAPELQSAFDQMGLGIQFDHYLGVKNTALIQVPETVSVADLQKALGGLSDFLAVEPNTLGAVDATLPNDPLFSSQYGLNNTGQTGGTADADIDAPEAWDITKGYSGTVVGVIDTGVDYNHPDLAGNIWTNSGEIAGNGLDDDGDGYVDDVHGYDFVGSNDSDPMDDVGHGTHVAGTIGAVGNNGIGVSGVAWDVSIMAIKWIAANGVGATGDAIEAVNYATQMRNRGVNIRVTNNSWHTLEGYNLALKNAIQSSGTAGMLFIAAAGNNSENNDTSPTANYPATFGLDNIISVAASDNLDHLASFSNFGSVTVDLAAPGVAIRSTVPTVGDPSIVDPSGYNYLNGTSMASPHVAGAAALAFSLKPNASYQQVRDAIFQGVDTKSTLTGIVATNGRLNVFNTLNLLAPATVTVNGDENGASTADTILVRVDPGNSANFQVLVNGNVRAARAIAGTTRIDVNGLYGSDSLSVDAAIAIPVSISGAGGSDTITGGAGNDILDGGANSDSIVGYLGNDSLIGGSGNDTLIGQSGNDTMSGGTGIDFMGGGNGSDWVDYQDKTTNLSISLDGVANDGETGLTGAAQFVGTNAASLEKDNADADIENIIAGSGNDYVGGNAAVNILYGERGNDILEGGAGSDTLYGSYGQDIYYAQDGIVDSLQNFDGDVIGSWVKDAGDVIFT